MALSLTPGMTAAQNSMRRKPLISLLATQIQDSMPFDGEPFDRLTTPEKCTALIVLSDTSLVGMFVRGGNRLVQVRTNTERTFWSQSTSAVNYGAIQGISIVETTTGHVGIAYTEGRNIRCTVLGNQSNQVLAPVRIEALPSGQTPRYPSVVRMTNGLYLLAYVVSSSSTYQIITRTSADFASWSEPAVIVSSDRHIANLSLIQRKAGASQVVLFYDRVTRERDNGQTVVRNVIQTSSTDNGASWTAPQQVTSYTEWGTSCLDPYPAERANGSIALAYTDQRTVLAANSDTMLWETDCPGGGTNATNIHFDPATRRLYVYQINADTGTKNLCGVVVIDTETWEVIKTYTTYSSPSYHRIFSLQDVWWQKDHGEGRFVVFSTRTMTKVLCVIDDSKSILTEYAFSSNNTLEITKNVNVVWPHHRYLDIEEGMRIRATWVDAASGRVYVLMAYSYVSFRAHVLGYIDTADTIDAATGLYPFHVVNSGSNIWTEAQVMGTDQIIVVPERNYIIVLASSALGTNPSYPGKTTIIDITSGEILKEFTTSSHQGYPHSGVYYACYHEGHLYGSFDYVAFGGYENRRGMVKINLDTEEITYHQPTWKTANSYGLRQKVPAMDGRILVAVIGAPGGVASFDINTGAWELYSAGTMQGFEPGWDYSPVMSVAYDPVKDQIMCGSIRDTINGGFVGVRMFSSGGAYNIGRLVTGVDSGGFVWGTPQDLTVGHNENDQAVVVDADNVLWAIWTRIDGNLSSTYWDRDVKEMELAPYLVSDQPVTLSWSLEKTGTLSFTVANGHLFDPNNAYSAWSTFLQKGKQIEVLIGENYQGIDYWQPQGKYIVDSLRIDYARGQYPIMRVDCVSPDYIWGDIEVAATARYDTSNPENMATALLMAHAGMRASDINMPNFPNRHEIHHQWLDTDFANIISEVLDHFQCVPYFDMDGRFSPRVIGQLNQPVSHTYRGAEVIKFTPDDNYSSYTNRIVVNGEGLYFVEVTYEEELMETIHGTAGWWESDKKVIRVNYSHDGDRVCYDPRLVVLTSIKDFKILWSRSGGDEFLSYIDPNNRYCEVTVICPGIMDVLIAAILLLIAVGAAAATCIFRCGAYIFALSVVSSGISYILGQVASYSYEVYAKPTGEEKQLVSAQVDDTKFQRDLGGLVVTETIDDPFCYTTQSCRQVALHEMAVVRAQRHRVKFEKLAHLRDEVCDRIQTQHPYSGAVLDVFITDLVRTYTRPTGDSDSGGVIDSITGWRL